MKYASESFSDIGKKIRALRRELGMTQKSLADGIITRNMLSRIENGEALPSLQTLSDIAARLGCSMGYLLDNSDDGTSLKNERLLSLIKKEYEANNYDVCLNYLKALNGFDEERELLSARCRYLLGIEKMMNDSSVKEAQKLISDSLKSEDLLTEKMVREGRAYRALLDGFSFSDGNDNDEEYLIRVGEFTDGPCDIGIFCDLLKLSLTETQAAKLGAEAIKFENSAYRSVLLGAVALKEKEGRTAFAKLIDAYSKNIPSVIKCYVLSLLEKTSVLLNELDRAYVYMSERKALEKKLR